jgi:hypothetical protein
MRDDLEGVVMVVHCLMSLSEIFHSWRCHHSCDGLQGVCSALSVSDHHRVKFSMTWDLGIAV